MSTRASGGGVTRALGAAGGAAVAVCPGPDRESDKSATANAVNPAAARMHHSASPINPAASGRLQFCGERGAHGTLRNR